MWQPGHPGELLVSASVLADRDTQHLVFRLSPRDAESDDGATIIEALRKEQRASMTDLARALTGTRAPWIVQLEGQNFKTLDLNGLAGCVCQQAQHLALDFELRKPALTALCSDHVVTGERRRAIRLLAHGRPERLESNETLWILPDDEIAARATEALLRQRGQDWQIVPTGVKAITTGDDRKALGVVEVTDRQLLDWLREAPSGVRTERMSDDDRLAVLHTVAGGGDRDLFFRLPLHRTRPANDLRPAFTALQEGKTFRTGIDIPAAVATGVTIIAEVADPRVQAAYRDWLHEFDVRALVDVLLLQDRPNEHTALIINTLSRPTGSLVPLAPAFASLAQDLNTIPWLSRRSGCGIAPVDVVDDLACADAVRIGVQALVRVLPGVTVASELDVHDTTAIRELVRHLNQGRSPVAALVDVVQRNAAGGPPNAWVTVSRSLDLTDVACDALLQHPPVGQARRGWSLLQEVEANCGVDKGTRGELVQLMRALRGGLGPTDWAATLNALAPRASGAGTEDLRTAWSELASAMPRSEIAAILPKLRLLCADGKWRDATQLSSCLFGVPEKCRPHDRVAEWLGLGGDPVIKQADTLVDATSRVLAPEELCSAIERWVAGTVQRPVLGAVFALTGSPALEAVAQRWLGEIDIKAMRAELGVSPDPFGSIRQVRLLLSSSKATQLRVPGLCGDHVVVDSDGIIEELLEGDPRRYVTPPIWPNTRSDLARLDIVLRACDFSRLDSETRKAVLKRTAAAFARAILGDIRFKQTPFETWWKRYGEGSQAAIEPVRALLLDELPFKFEELRVRDVAGLAPVNEAADRIRRLKLARYDAQRSGRSAEVERQLREGHADIERCMHNATIATSLRELVRRHLDKFAYSPASVLLELIQNADDALEQLAGMRGAPLPERARSVRIRVHSPPGSASPTVSLVHWGRLINDHGGFSFPRGRQQQWDQDLYFMLRFQVSGKLGVDDSSGGVQSTGHFGLGFKSVHLVSDDPQVRSGDLAFRIDAALLPTEIKASATADSDEEIEYLMPTCIDMPLRVDLEPQELLDKMFGRIGPIAGLLPAMSRQIMSLDLPADRGGATVLRAQPLSFAPGWTFGDAPVAVGKKTKKYNLLRFRRPVEGGTIRTLLIGVEDGVPTPLPADTPTFWVVAPTQECWDVGYAVNGDFKLDTGRVRVDFGADKCKAYVRALGEEFGEALVALAQGVLQDPARCSEFGFAEPPIFIRELWITLAKGLIGSAPDRETVLLDLHGDARGLGRLSSELPAVPSGMPSPWSQLVGPIGHASEIRQASSAATAPSVQPLFRSIPDLHCADTVVSQKIADVLSKILKVRARQLNVVDCLKAWTIKRKEEVSPVVADQLYPLVDPDCWKELEAEGGHTNGTETPLRSWATQLKFTAADGSTRHGTELLLPQRAEDHRKDLAGKRDTFDDEILRSAFAPTCSLLAPAYAENRRRVDVFLRLRGELAADAKTLAKWAREALAEDAQKAAARYLARGQLRTQVADSIRGLGGLPWAPDRARWKAAATLAALSPEERQTAEIALFGAIEQPRYEGSPTPEVPPPMGQDEATARLKDLWEKWNEPAYRAQRLDAQRKALWPTAWTREQIGSWLRGSLSESESRRAWMTLFLLAHVQGLGLGGRDGVQHKHFVMQLQARKSRVQGQKWWDRLFGDSAPDETWTDFLDEWSRDRMDGGKAYSFWMRVLPDMYAATKWWRIYAESLRAFGARPQSLVPATDEDLAGDADSTGVPAMAGALNRVEWIRGELQYFGIVPAQVGVGAPREGFRRSEKLTEVLHRLGFFQDRDGAAYASGEVYDWLCELIEPKRADFHGLCATPLEIDAQFLLRP